MAENNLGNTQYFRTKPDQELQVKEVLDLVYTAMDEKGYNPVSYTHLDVYKRQTKKQKKHCANSMRRVVTVRNQKILMILKNRKRRKRVSWIN